MKKLAILLTIALLTGLFAGCQSSSEKPDVTEDSKQKTETDATDGYPSGTLYYKTANGYDILFSPGTLFGPFIEVIAGEAFGYSTSFHLFAYKDGEKLLLQDAYEAGLVTKEDIAAARDAHNQRLGLDNLNLADCCPAPVYKERQQRVEDAWLAAGNETFGTWYTEDTPDGDWRYYGDYLMFYCGGEQEEVFTTIQIGDVTFSHPTTFQLYTLDVDMTTLITMEDFYDQYGYVNQIEEAAQLHKQTNDTIYGEGWDSQQ